MSNPCFRLRMRSETIAQYAIAKDCWKAAMCRMGYTFNNHDA